MGLNLRIGTLCQSREMVILVMIFNDVVFCNLAHYLYLVPIGRGFYGGKYLDSPFLGFVLGLIFSEERFKFVVTLFSPNLLVNINIEKGKKVSTT